MQVLFPGSVFIFGFLYLQFFQHWIKKGISWLAIFFPPIRVWQFLYAFIVYLVVTSSLSFHWTAGWHKFIFIGTVIQQDKAVGRNLGSGATPAGVHLKVAFLIYSLSLYFRYVFGSTHTFITCMGAWWRVEWIYNIETSPVGSLKRTHIRMRPPCLLRNHDQRHWTCPLRVVSLLQILLPCSVKITTNGVILVKAYFRDRG